MATLNSRTSTQPPIPMIDVRGGRTSVEYASPFIRALMSTSQLKVVLERISFVNVAQAFLSDEERWLSYVRSLGARNLTTVVVAVATERLWRRLRTAIPRVTLPNASPTDDFGLSMSWNLDRHYLEIEVLPSGDYDWYYRDRDARTNSSESAQPVDAAPTELLKALLQTIFA